MVVGGSEDTFVCGRLAIFIDNGFFNINFFFIHNYGFIGNYRF